MSQPTNDNGRGQAAVGEAGKAGYWSKYSAAPSCAKAAAVALYLYGILPLERIAAMFRRNPAWRSA